MVKICNNNPNIHATAISFTSNLQLYELLFSAHYTESVYNMLVYTGTCALHFHLCAPMQDIEPKILAHLQLVCDYHRIPA